MKKLSGWGRYPVTNAQLIEPFEARNVRTLLAGRDSSFRGIARGLGRSYGDSALARQVLDTTRLDEFADFDPHSGLLRCDAGCRLDEILRLFVPSGWFLPVVPGTAAVTVGGAIASDVHGKNHHHAGCFSDHVAELLLATADGATLRCSAYHNREVFLATCGGMGLTGVILEASIRLRPVPGPAIEQRSYRAANLEDSFERLQSLDRAAYSVAWLDCMARGRKLGRSILFAGEHVEDSKELRAPGRRPSVPFATPGWLLNKASISAFNNLYYRVAGRHQSRRLHYRDYFFPLDAIANWNRLYGRRGFLQYQCVLPERNALAGMHRLLDRISASGKGSFLSVLKKLGPANANLLSFPMAGYTLALDFKNQPGLAALLEELDRIVLEHGGRLYLTKDARMDCETFRRGYPQWQRFVEVRRRLGAHRRFHSLQSRRLGL